MRRDAPYPAYTDSNINADNDTGGTAEKFALWGMTIWRIDMTLRRFSSRTHRLDASFLLRHLQGAHSYKRIAGYFTSSLFEVANELLESIPEVKIVCNVDIHPGDLKVAQLREARMLGRWNEQALEAEALLNRDRYRRLDAFLQKHGQAIRVAPDTVCGFVHGKAGVITPRWRTAGNSGSSAR